MSELDENKNRRISDYTEEGKEPTTQDSWQLAISAHSRINELKIDHDLLRRAFLKDDLDTPDYDGHRKSHIKFQDAEKLVQDYKVSMTKDVLKMIVGFLAGLFVVGLTAYFKT